MTTTKSRVKKKAGITRWALTRKDAVQLVLLAKQEKRTVTGMASVLVAEALAARRKVCSDETK